MRIENCPFCGSRQVKVVGTGSAVSVRCECGACGAGGPLNLSPTPGTGLGQPFPKVNEGAIRKWNERANDGRV